MTNLFPGADWRPMPGQEKRPKRRKGRGVGFHIAVSERSSIYEINLGTGNDAHLYVRRDGSCEQNVDLDLVAYAGAAGNPSMIWVETQGGTTPADVKSGRWTPQQAETLAQIAAWANRTEGAPLQVMPDSRPASRGIGTHRLGVQHSRGVGAVPGWLVAGGERWTKHIGKECPGDARIGQVSGIVARAQQIVNGDDDMAFGEAERVTLNDVLRETMAGRRQEMALILANQTAMKSTVDALVKMVAADDANPYTLEQLREAIRAETEDAVQKIVRVQVSVVDGDPATGPVS